MNPNLMTIQDFAREIGKSFDTARRYIRQGKGPTTVIVGKTPLIMRADFDAWLQAQRAAV